jgi:hypothetical protein
MILLLSISPPAAEIAQDLQTGAAAFFRMKLHRYPIVRGQNRAKANAVIGNT